MRMYNPPHPGEVLKDTLIDGCGLTVTGAADILDVSRVSLSKILNGKSGVSPEMAVRISIALNTSSEMWLNLQAAYDLWEAEKKRKKLTAKVRAAIPLEQRKAG
ncbi:MAG: HigA family addiction module antitoxin [Gammaproteobacteria bacterium]